MLLDPNQYDAALFTGDVYFKQGVYGSAGEWFARAIQIDPNRETAYRYWGDALMRMDKSDDARSKYISAIIAEPYKRRSWEGAENWAAAHKEKLHFFELRPKSQVTQQDDTHVTLTLDENSMKRGDFNTLAWTTYGMERSLWRTKKFKKEFPNEPQYRHTAKEETEALKLMVDVLKEQKDFGKKSKDLEPGILELIRLDEAGLLEPYVLLNHADQEVLKDYPAYRGAHREKVLQYLSEFVVPKVPTSSK